jgi:AmiR/NasT family two-component response regulator
MPTALVSSIPHPDAPPLLDDLHAVGITGVAAPDRSLLLRDVIRTAPDLVIVWDAMPEDALFECMAAVGTQAPCPVVVFTRDPDAGKIERAVRSGIHAYIVNGYSRARLRSLVHLAQARFRFDQVQRDELAGLSQRFSERKLVDRAKGILMGARQLREEEAYSALRSAAMRTKQRIGLVARQVIDSALYAEAVNRSGQLRMLSQRLVKLYALGCAGTRPAEVAALFAGSLVQVEANIATLGKTLSRPTFGDLLDAVTAPWGALRRALALPASAGRIAEVDALAEEMLLSAEVLTESLEVAGFAVALHVVNVAGRQRMLSQRFAKDALISVGLDGAASVQSRHAMAATAEQIEASLGYLDALPMTNPEIAGELRAARAHWAALLGLPAAGSAAWHDGVAEVSELLLASFERLTDHLERAVHAMLA